MRGFLILIVLIIAGVAGLGFYRGWFHLASDSAADKPNVTLTVDKNKIEEDKTKAVDKMQDLGHQAKEKAAATTQKTKDLATSATTKR